MEDEMKALREKIISLQMQLAKRTRSHEVDLREESDRRKAEREVFEEQFARLRNRIKELEEKNAKLTADLADSQSSLRLLREQADRPAPEA